MINEELAKGIIVGLFALRYGNNQPCRPNGSCGFSIGWLGDRKQIWKLSAHKSRRGADTIYVGTHEGMRARLHEAIPRKDIPEVNQVYQLRKPNTFPSGFVGRVVSSSESQGMLRCQVSSHLRKY